ncbi:MAG TPA: TolC family protein [Edaphobacter sp.]|jgi:outer membrane protein TolC|nr:TolC family protein [Edaphobacter sp.]
MIQILRLCIACSAFASAIAPAYAQISFSTAIGLALKSSPKVLTAQADVDKALAALQQIRNAFIPNIVGGSGVGPPSYGYPLGQPSIFNITSQSLVFSFSQHDYLRAAQASLDATRLNLKDIREGVAEDTAVTYLSLDRDLQRQAALQEQQGFSDRLVNIVQERLDAGQDTTVDLTTCRLTAAQIRLARLRAEDETAADQAHLARLIGLPAQALGTTSSSVPAFPNTSSEPTTATAMTTSPAVESAYAVARAKRETAFGEARYLWRPQIYFQGQYSRFAKYTNIQDYYLRFQQNNAAVGVQITVPLYDAAHRAKERESAAEAARAQHEADTIRDQFFDSRIRARHTAAELSARTEIAVLDQQLARQQLDIMLVQLKAGSGNLSGPQMTPKDEQTARIAEREKFVAMLNATFEAQQAAISLMRAAGELEAWIATTVRAQPSSPSKP